MPELPEVECVRRGLARARLRAPIVDIWRSDKALRTGTQWRDERLGELVGATPQRWVRRGKFLVWRLQAPAGDLGLVVHLGMTGRMSVQAPDEPMVAHTHVRVRLADDRELRFVDPRRFGGVRAGAWSRLWAEPPLGELGPEPLATGFDGATLAARAAASRRALCDVLLDQRVVAGVGNIYAQEALHRAGLHPLVAADRLRASAWDRLAAAVVDVLGEGVTHGGTTLRDYRDVSGNAGRNQNRLRVYGRAGQACTRCGAELRGYEHAGRRGAWCPVDQPRTGRRRID